MGDLAEVLDGIVEAVRLLAKRVERLERAMEIRPGGRRWVRP
ncbi:MAG: hypothetical protein V3U45_05935 [bacterium]